MSFWPWSSVVRPKPHDSADARRKQGEQLLKLLHNYNAKNKEKILALISNGADVNLHTKDGFTPVIHAAQNNEQDILTALIRAGANVSGKTQHGDTALTWLAFAGDNRQMAEALLQKDPTLLHQTSITGHNALHIAGGHGRSALAQYLLDSGIEYRQKNSEALTPHDHAIKHGHPEIAALIAQRERMDNTPKFGDYVVVDDMNVKTSIGDGLTVTFNFLTQQALYRDPAKPDAVVALSPFDTFPNKDMVRQAHAALAQKNPETAPPAPFSSCKKTGMIVT